MSTESEILARETESFRRNAALAEMKRAEAEQRMAERRERTLAADSDQLAQLRADIYLTARVVTALGCQPLRGTDFFRKRYSYEKDEQQCRLLNLLARERAMTSTDAPAEVAVEAVAKALWEQGGAAHWEEQTYEIKKCWRESAQVAIAAMGKRPAGDVGELLTMITKLLCVADTVAGKLALADDARALVAKWRRAEAGR